MHWSTLWGFREELWECLDARREVYDVSLECLGASWNGLGSFWSGGVLERLWSDMEALWSFLLIFNCSEPVLKASWKRLVGVSRSVKAVMRAISSPWLILNWFWVAWRSILKIFEMKTMSSWTNIWMWMRARCYIADPEKRCKNICFGWSLRVVCSLKITPSNEEVMKTQVWHKSCRHDDVWIVSLTSWMPLGAFLGIFNASGPEMERWP